MGVDMFFVLSGFLISFILLKECDKYENKIDVFNFYRGRYIRLTPVIAIWVLFNNTLGIQIGESLDRRLWTFSFLTFTNNLWQPGTAQTHLWSTACEFQFYLLAPFILKWMINHKHISWLPALVINIITCLLVCMIIFIIWPDVL